MLLKQLEFYMVKNELQSLPHNISQTNLQCITNLNVKPGSVNLLDENVRKRNLNIKIERLLK